MESELCVIGDDRDPFSRGTNKIMSAINQHKHITSINIKWQPERFRWKSFLVFLNKWGSELQSMLFHGTVFGWQKAVSIIDGTIKHTRDRYQIELAGHVLQQRLDGNLILREQYKRTIRKYLKKIYIITVDQMQTICLVPSSETSEQQTKTRQNPKSHKRCFKT